MARKKKSRRDGEKKRESVARGFGNRPFSGIKLIVETEQPIAEQGLSPSPEPVLEPSLGHDDALAEMMAGATPVKGASLAEKEIKAKPLLLETHDTLSATQQMEEVIYGVADFNVADTDEFIEAFAQGLDKRILRRLRHGEYSYERHLDLHGMRREEARTSVSKFIEQAHFEGKRCVLIVHGRGLRSKDNVPVLKEKLRSWLTRGSMGKKVLAYTSATPLDGGTGAVYVLLRG